MGDERVIVESSPNHQNLLYARFEGNASAIERIALDIYCEDKHRETLYLTRKDGEGFKSGVFAPCAAKMEIKARPAFEVVVNGERTEALEPAILPETPEPAADSALEFVEIKTISIGGHVLKITNASVTGIATSHGGGTWHYVDSALLAEDQEIQAGKWKIKLPKGTELKSSPEGKLRAAILSKDTEIQGLKCPKGTVLRFNEDENLIELGEIRLVAPMGIHARDELLRRLKKDERPFRIDGIDSVDLTPGIMETLREKFKENIIISIGGVSDTTTPEMADTLKMLAEKYRDKIAFHTLDLRKTLLLKDAGGVEKIAFPIIIASIKGKEHSEEDYIQIDFLGFSKDVLIMLADWLVREDESMNR